MAALALYQTTIGKKIVMALTGLILSGYVVIHMIGNLKIYQGQKKLDEYALFLREVGGPILIHEQLLWMFRVVLLISVLLHIWSAWSLTRLDLASRPVGYRQKRFVNASYAARTMRWGGVIVGLFIVYHILHLTTGTLHSSFGSSVYTNVVNGFKVLPVSAFYILANLALALHLYHGVWSMFQTLGLNNRGRTRFWGGVAVVIAVAVAVGNISIPIAVLAGIVK